MKSSSNLNWISGSKSFIFIKEESLGGVFVRIKNNIARTGLFIVSSFILSPLSFAERVTASRPAERRSIPTRIERGVNYGTLTRVEADALNAQRQQIQDARVQADSDGKRTLQERADIARQKANLSREVYQQKHDDQNAGAGLLQRRINNGIDKGRLTEAQAAEAQNSLNQIREQARAAKSDGKVTYGERADILEQRAEFARELRQQKKANDAAGISQEAESAEPAFVDYQIGEH